VVITKKFKSAFPVEEKKEETEENTNKQ